MAVLVQGFVKFIPIRISRVWSLAVPSNSIGNRLSLSTHASFEETTVELLNQILAADNNNPSISREEICINYIHKLCAAGNLTAAARLPENLRGKHIYLSPRAYNYLLEAADRKNDIEMLSQVFKDLLLNCGSISLISYLIVARAIGKHKDPVMLLNFIREVCELELNRIDIVLNRFIFALAKCGYVESALLVVDCMKSLKCKPDLVTYNTVLAILGRLGRVDDMLRVFECMKTVDLIPDIVTYNTVLNSLRKMGKIDLCLLYFKEMSEKGIQPDSMTYKALIESLGRSGHIDEALKLFDEMKRKGIDPSVHIYQALIFSLKKMGKMDLALKFSTEMNKLLRGSVVPRDFRYKSR
ncbi:pentatricopeptide repeat-containing protein at1g11900 [Phtheirospermum japonicum]|uniref:Pentatricopeptide repeat-containing protein at1g11900 n=1 Tax=Phtheirospermum japonicum TaxID=374723 RepID=A0A830BPH5_9LAMI|nr:pentatricopeptide repeat-containing protein at1g11900 [Phtheirospermum japonicum]